MSGTPVRYRNTTREEWSTQITELEAFVGRLTKSHRWIISGIIIYETPFTPYSVFMERPRKNLKAIVVRQRDEVVEARPYYWNVAKQRWISVHSPGEQRVKHLWETWRTDALNELGQDGWQEVW